MRSRPISLLTVIALVLVACGGGESADISTTETPATTTKTTAPAPEAVRLSYALEPGTSLDFELDIAQHIDLIAEGSGAALGEQEIPGQMSVDLNGTTTFEYSVAQGPEEGTYEVTITGDFRDLEITGTMDGQPLDTAKLPNFAAMTPVDVTVVVDEQGNVIPSHDGFGGFFGGMGDLGSLGDLGAAGMDPGRFVGPPFSDGEVTVGDSWSETLETPGLFDGEGITTVVTSEVIGTDTVDGAAVFVIETNSITAPIEFDLAELFIGLFTAFISEDATAEEQAELEALAEELRFHISIGESSNELTTWFDSEAGVSRMAEYVGGLDLVMDLNVPDQETGDMAGLIVDMSIDQHITYQLLDSSGA